MTEQKQKEIEQILETRTFAIFSEITEEVEYDTTRLILRLNQESFNPIKLLINTGGGNVIAGIQIADSILFSKAPIDAYVYSECSSSGLMVLAACRKRIGLPSSQYLFHSMENGTQFKSNHAYGASINDQIKDFLTASQKLNDYCINLLASRLKISKKEVIELEKYGERNNLSIDAEKALEIGLLTKIAKDKKDWIW